MSENDLRKVFQVHSHDEVPEYDVVHLRIVNKRSASSSLDDETRKRVALNAFGKKLHLNLQPNSEFDSRLQRMKIFSARSAGNGGLRYVEETPEESSASFEQAFGASYHDDENMAAVMLRQASDGGLQMDGTIGNELVIKPVPDSLSPPPLPPRDDDEIFLDDELDATSNKNNEHHANVTSQPNSTTKVPKVAKNDGGKERKGKKTTGAHFVFRKKMHEDGPHSDYLEVEPGHHDQRLPNLGLLDHKELNVTSSNRAHRRSKRQSPDTVWPEVLLVVDYDSYLLHGGNSRDVKRYFISFWNGVDLRYKLLSHPRIRVSLAGMIVAKDRDATPYLERNRLRAPNADAVDAAGALTDMGKYLYREDRLPTYDLAVVITKLDMCRRRYEGGRCNRGTAGFAYVGGACVVNKRLEKVNSVAIIEDSGGFSGIIVAAHEVGHLLGCVHDGSPPPSYLGGPGATRCPWEDGFIMSDLRHTERGFKWSSCSTEQFKHFLNGETATCLYNYPHENQLLPRVLPGTMLTLDEQCKRDRGTNACFKDARVCAQLFCFDSASGYCVSYRPAAEGSTCGDGQVCRNGKCAAELENIIPDYSQVVSRSQPSTDRLLSRSDTFSPPVALAAVGSLKPRLSPQSQRFRGRNYGRAADEPVTALALPLSPSSSSPSGPLSSQKKACRDITEKMAGSLSCTDFLDRFGYRYCNHNYVKRNCCESHALMCNKEA
ncbi:A disintegrin and metalloproteinase with thrombospondin motifs 16 [Halotydeus destructor]|nr:A disintegrin and metalloproteinase with thrombospondin motifs 16 [Halotydeus destructor]